MTYTARRSVGYYYDSDVGNFYYAQGHPMKPHRMRMTHNLLLAYGLADKMQVLSTPRATERDMTRFHADEYISFLRNVSPELIGDHSTNLTRFNVLDDCPVFDGLWDYCQIAAGGSLAAASRLNSGQSDIAVNWAGGLHHAKKAEASGFCYINDCVLAILELLKVHARVLYVDIDIHHGDGVEEAFYTTDRVMTASFHKFGDYFPGTGDVIDVGISKGKYYSANFPLRDGIDDESYRRIFEPVMRRIMEWYQPSAIVLQCGADSLSGDRLGCFNLSLRGHAQCVDFFKRYDVPLLLLGGGGYTIRNVARCWAFETSRVVGVTLPDKLPYNENYEFYGPEFRLHIAPSNMENHNSPSELHNTTMKIFENLRHLPFAPSTGLIDTSRVPALGLREHNEDDEDADARLKNRRPRYVVDYEGSDIEDDDQYVSSLRYAKRKQRRINFPRRRYLSADTSAIGDQNIVRLKSPSRPDERNVNGDSTGNVNGLANGDSKLRSDKQTTIREELKSDVLEEDKEENEQARRRAPLPVRTYYDYSKQGNEGKEEDEEEPRLLLSSMQNNVSKKNRDAEVEEGRQGRTMMESSFREAVNRRLRDQAEDDMDVTGGKAEGAPGSDSDVARNGDNKSRCEDDEKTDDDNATKDEEHDHGGHGEQEDSGMEDVRDADGDRTPINARDTEEACSSTGVDLQERELVNRNDSRDSIVRDSSRDGDEAEAVSAIAVPGAQTK